MGINMQAIPPRRDFLYIGKKEIPNDKFSKNRKIVLNHHVSTQKFIFYFY